MIDNLIKKYYDFISRFGLSSFQLKVIAIITMTIDHTGITLLRGTQYYDICRNIGRLAFPIFCFLITEGFTKTRDVKKYALRLLIFACISEIPFNYMLDGRWFSFKHQNVFFTLLLGLLLIWWYSYFNLKNRYYIALAGVPAFMAVAYLLKTDYSWWGVMLIFLFYAFKDKLLYAAGFTGASMLLYGGREKYAVFSLVPIMLYNGKKGHSIKYFFYAYYPLHIIILCVLRYYIRYHH